MNEVICLPRGYIGRLISEIADSTLEIYLVQITILSIGVTFVFPIGWILFILLSIVLGMRIRKGFRINF